MKLKIGSRLGKYRLQKLLGEGGFARVYQALDTIEGVPVAVKIPHSHHMTRQALDWFRKEARTQASLDHPNILQLKNAEKIGEHFVIVYPLGERTLEQRLRSRLGFEAFLKLAEQILEAVAFAHRKQVIHCDLKPENFLLFPGNRLRLTDFGIAKISLRTVEGSGSGTMGYMAPEQALGRPSPRSDVFSIGLLLYRMLTRELLQWPFRWPGPGFDQLRRKAHPDFQGFLQRALEIDPARRFRDAHQMLAAYRRLMPRTKRFAARQRLRRNGGNDAKRADWKSIRFRQFRREYNAILGLTHSCKQCGGPTSEPMAHCPWCGAAQKYRHQATRFPARCGRCHRGRKLDWRYCAWCYGPGFEEVATRSFTDKSYEGRCPNAACHGPLMPFMRYCPWCRRKVHKAWRIPGSSARCERCGWGTVREYWDHCAWCGNQLRKRPSRRTAK